MDTFIDSSWYWYRYLSPHKPARRSTPTWSRAWTPVEQYTGGAEHAVMHLLYAREFTKMMRDIGLVQQNEPWKRLFNQGQILGPDGERMSKSRGNAEDPDDLVARYGADTIRLFLMFMGPWDQGGPWSPTGIGGVHRFLNRVWTIALDPHGREPGDPESGSLPAGEDEAAARPRIRAAAHRTLRVVTGDYEAFKFNTMVAQLIELANTLLRYRGTSVAGCPSGTRPSGCCCSCSRRRRRTSPRSCGRAAWPRGQPWASIHAERGRRSTDRRRRRDPRGPGPGQRQAPRPGHGPGRDQRSRSSRSCSHATSPGVLGGREPDAIVQAGGGRLVNIVVR